MKILLRLLVAAIGLASTVVVEAQFNYQTNNGTTKANQYFLTPCPYSPKLLLVGT